MAIRDNLNDTAPSSVPLGLPELHRGGLPAERGESPEPKDGRSKVRLRGYVVEQNSCLTLDFPRLEAVVHKQEDSQSPSPTRTHDSNGRNSTT